MSEMTRGKRKHTATLEVQLLREGIVESSHQVRAVVCDNRGRVMSMAGNGEENTFIRSALKPFQALAVTTTGTLERYSLTDRDLAIICSSHQGPSNKPDKCLAFCGTAMSIPPSFSVPFLPASNLAWNTIAPASTREC